MRSLDYEIRCRSKPSKRGVLAMIVALAALDVGGIAIFHPRMRVLIIPADVENSVEMIITIVYFVLAVFSAIKAMWGSRNDYWIASALSVLGGVIVMLWPT